MQAINGNNGQRLAKRLHTVESMYGQWLKLVKRMQWKQGEARLIRECKWPHLLLQRDPMDVIYLNEADIVIGMEFNTKRYKLRRRMNQAVSVLEVPPGTIARTGTQVGHEIRYIIQSQTGKR